MSIPVWVAVAAIVLKLASTALLLWGFVYVARQRDDARAALDFALGQEKRRAQRLKHCRIHGLDGCVVRTQHCPAENFDRRTTWAT